MKTKFQKLNFSTEIYALDIKHRLIQLVWKTTHLICIALLNKLNSLWLNIKQNWLLIENFANFVILFK